MALSGTEYSMTVMAAFHLSLLVILSSVPFSIDIDILDFFPKLVLYRSCPFSQGDLGYAEDRIILSYVSRLLGRLLHILGFTLPRLGPWAPM